METSMPTMAELFAQLGLPGESDAIDRFIAAHSPLPDNIRLHDAPFWTPAQAAFLKEQFFQDGPWIEMIETLNAELRAKAKQASAGG